MSYPKSFAGGAFFKDRPKAGPLRTFVELAEEFGLTPGQLGAKMRWSKHETPTAACRHHGGLQSTKTYYDPKAMRAWWAKETA